MVAAVRLVELCPCGARLELELEADEHQAGDAVLARWRVNHHRCTGLELTADMAARYVAGHPWPTDPTRPGPFKFGAVLPTTRQQEADRLPHR